MSTKYLRPVYNYMYLYHLDKMIIIPTYPEQMIDQSSANFQSETILGRSAPIYSYTGSGPRTLSVNLKLHRELVDQVNGTDEDTIEVLIRGLQSAIMPDYSVGTKMVNPPLVAVKFGSDIYIKGIINGSVSITWDLPIIKEDKYAIVNIGFSITETTPFSARDILSAGSYRCVGNASNQAFTNSTTGLIRNISR